MAEPINEAISVDLLYNHIRNTVHPWIFTWHGRQYRCMKTGIHYTIHKGTTLFHIFTVSDAINCYKLELDTETLRWRLMEVETA